MGCYEKGLARWLMWNDGETRHQNSTPPWGLTVGACAAVGVLDEPYSASPLSLVAIPALQAKLYGQHVMLLQNAKQHNVNVT